MKNKNSATTIANCEQKVKSAILRVKPIYTYDKKWNGWANMWLSGKNRSKKSAARAATDAYMVYAKTQDIAAYGAARVCDAAYYFKCDDDQMEFTVNYICCRELSC